MEDIRVDEYVRTIHGIIGKVIDIISREYLGKVMIDATYRIDVKEKDYSYKTVDLSQIKEHSFKLADLAEPGDIGVMDCYGFQVKKFLTKEDIFELRTENYELLEILTKERFEKEKYVVGGAE